MTPRPAFFRVWDKHKADRSDKECSANAAFRAQGVQCKCSFQGTLLLGLWKPLTAECHGVQAHREGKFPVDLLPEVAKMGLFGANIEGYGCAGMNTVSYGLVMQVCLPRAGNLPSSHCRVYAGVRNSAILLN